MFGALLCAAALCGSAAAQAPPVVTLDETSGSTGQLGVDARGGAVAAWSDYAADDAFDSVFARVRRPGGAFGATTRLSTAEVQRPFALAVGSGGHAAVAWSQSRPRSSARELVVARARPGGRFGAPTTVPSTGRTAGVAMAIDVRGRMLVTWLQASHRKGCGSVVMVSTAPARGGFSTARRVSGACPNAALARVALARSGAGAIVWRSGRSLETDRTRFGVQVSTYARGRFAAPRTVSRGRVWYGQPALAAGGERALLAWRDQARTTRGGPTLGRVLTASIAEARIGAPVAVSTSDAIEGDVYAAMSRADAAVVTWTQRAAADSGNRVAIRASATASFAAPEAISVCATGVLLDGSGRDHLDSAARVGLDGRGRAVAVFGNGCSDGVGAARRPAGGPWAPALELARRTAQSLSFRILSMGVSDAGEGVVAWSAAPPDAPSFDDAALRVAVLPAP